VAVNLQRFAYNSFEEAFPDGIRGFNRPTNVRFGPDGCAMSPIMVRFAILGAPTPTPVDFTITLDPNVNAFFGDVNGDGKTGLSDIFSTITLSADHRTITYSDGLIPVGGRFTDYIFSMTDNGEPFKAGVYTSFDGFLTVPEPATWAILLHGSGRGERPAPESHATPVITTGAVRPQG
jgi:hypothetical protein